MDIFKAIKSLVSAGTKYVTSIVDAEENIEELEVTYLDSPNAVGFGTNLLLQNILQSSYGIGVADLLPDGVVESADGRVIDLQPILKNFDYTDCKILDNGTDIDILDYIYKHFQINTWNDFIDTIYKNLRQIIYTGKTIDKINYQFDMDKTTNEMVSCLACTIARYNTNFSDIRIGEDSIINIPFDTERIDVLEDYIWDYLSTKGYISQNITRNLWHFPQDFYNIFTDSPLNSDGFFKYCHFSIKYDNTSKSWMCVFYITGVEIDHLRWTGSFGFPWQKCTAKYSVVCIDKEGYVVDKSNLFGMIGAKDNERWCVFSHESELSTFEGSTWNSSYTQPQTVWCHRTNCDLIINDETVHYDSVIYDRNGTNHLSENNPYLGAWSTLPYDGGDWQCFADVNYGNNTGWNVYRYDQPNVSWTLPNHTERWVTEFSDDSTQVDVVINNVITEGAIKLKTPVVDTTTKDNLDDNDATLNNDIFGWLHIIINSVSAFLGMIPNLTPFDTTHALKIATIDRLNKRLLDTHSYVTDFIKTERPSLIPLWSNKLIQSDIMPPTNIGFCKQYYIREKELQLIADDLWQLSFFESLFNRDPMECIMKLFALPFVLQSGVDYKPYDPTTSEKAGIKATTDGQIPIVYGNAVVHKAHGFELGTTLSELWFDLPPIQINEDFTDYEPYTKANIWLPFIGYRAIDTSLIVNQRLKCVYTVNINTGDFIVRIYSANTIDGVMELVDGVSVVDTSDGTTPDGAYDEIYDGNQVQYDGNPIFFESGNMAYPMLLTGQYNNANQILDSVLKGIGHTIIGVGQAGAIGGAISAVGGVLNTSIVASQGNAIQSKGSIGSGNWMGHCRPYITIYYHQPIDDMQIGTVFDETVGHKSSYGLRIKDMKPGYHKLKAVKLDGLRCTLAEKERIKQILMNGFYYGLSKKRVKA